MILDEPRLDAAGTGHPFDRHRPDTGGPEQQQERQDRPVHLLCLRGRLGEQYPGDGVALYKDGARRGIDFRRRYSPDPVGPRLDLVQALTDGKPRADDVRWA